MIGNPDFSPEDYLLRKLAENFDYIQNKNVKAVNLSNGWSTELRNNNYNYTVHWVRKWIRDVIHVFKVGMIPPFAQTPELLPIAQELILKSATGNISTVANGPVRTCPYSEAEQEHILCRLAERVDDLRERTKGSKVKFVREILVELTKKGFNRSSHSISSWLCNVMKGRFPRLLDEPRMSIVRGVLTEAFGVGQEKVQNESSSDEKEKPTHDELSWESQETEPSDQLEFLNFEASESNTNTSNDDGTHLNEQMSKDDTIPMNLRTLLELSEQSVEVINCNPFVEDPLFISSENSPKIKINNREVLKRYQERKMALQTARKRKRVAEREVDEIREQLRLADNKVAAEAKKVHFLEEELEELKDYLLDKNV